MIQDYFSRNRVGYGLLLGASVPIFMQPGSKKLIITGLFVSFLGLLIRSWAAGCIKKSKFLCTEGPYAFTRHPLYLGSLFMSLGIIAVFTGSQPLWATIFLWAAYIVYFWSFYTAAITNEEKLLSERFANEWFSYKNRVPAFVPFRFNHLNNLSLGSFSLKQYTKNKEYNAVLGWLTVVILIFLIKRS